MRILSTVRTALAAAVLLHPVCLEAASTPDRRAPRHTVTPPAGSLTGELERRSATTFSSEVDDIVAAMSLSTYDAFLRGLSGWNPVQIGGGSVTIQTRYSLNPAGQACWQYAYETLEALGYDVRYQHYTRSGHALKNVVARIEGQTTPDRIYVLGGHIDSTSPQASTNAPGAEDNASGSAAVLAAAAALVGQQFDSTIELVLFSGEEQGLWGSDAYVDEAQAQSLDVRGAVTFDMIAAFQSNYGVLIEGENAWQSLMFLMGDAVDEYTSISRVYSYFSFGSDHVPFQQAGIPAILAIDRDWGSYPQYHQTTDTYNRLTPALGLDIAKAGVAAVAHLAGALGSPTDVLPTGSSTALGAFPNPTRQEATILFATATQGADAPARVYDLAGRRVATLPVLRTRSASPLASAETRWNLRDSAGRLVRPGVYWVRLGQESHRVVVAP